MLAGEEEEDLIAFKTLENGIAEKSMMFRHKRIFRHNEDWTYLMRTYIGRSSGRLHTGKEQRIVGSLCL